jgi:hypothetical protein
MEKKKCGNGKEREIILEKSYPSSPTALLRVISF